MEKELRKFLLNFPYSPRPRIIKEEVEEPSRVNNLYYFLPLFFLGVAGLLPFSSLHLVAGPLFLLEDQVVAGF